jgi:hypothetical protein
MLATSPGDDPISAGMVYIGAWAMGFVTAVCILGFLYKAFP